MDAVQELTHMAFSCACGNKMPARSVQLAERFTHLSARQQRQARAAMREQKLQERMARRALEVANFKVASASTIIGAMTRLFGTSATIRSLLELDYPSSLISRAERHTKHGNRQLAQLLLDHIKEWFGEEYLPKPTQTQREAPPDRATMVARAGRFHHYTDQIPIVDPAPVTA